MNVAEMNIGVNGWKTLAFKGTGEKLLFSRQRVKTVEEQNLLFPFSTQNFSHGLKLGNEMDGKMVLYKSNTSNLVLEILGQQSLFYFILEHFLLTADMRAGSNINKNIEYGNRVMFAALTTF